jgi:F-type H+-transporting ATPase subunit delta
MKETVLATRYARALFDFAKEQDFLEPVRDDMDTIIKVCEANRDFFLLLRSPIIKSDRKISIIQEIFGSVLREVTLSYLRIITQKHREAHIAGIARQYIVLYNEHKGVKVAHLISAAKVDDELRTKILSYLRKQTNAKIELVEEVDEKLIGGFILRFDGKQYDASIAKKILELRKDFEKNVYVRGF